MNCGIYCATSHGGRVGSGKVGQVSQDSVEVGVVDPLLQVGQHGLVLADVVDHGDHETHRVLVGGKLNVGSGQLHEDQDLLLVPHDARLTNREDVGGEGRNCQT